MFDINARAIATSACPVYCRFCTRSYAVGGSTDTVNKDTLRPVKRRWEEMFSYIENTDTLRDIIVSGGDSYMLSPDQLYEIGERLISIKHIRRFRYASKGLAVCPSRIVDPADQWVNALIEVSKLGRTNEKCVALHTHFNHSNEITWITALAAQKLFKEGVTVRNQSVLLRGVNDDVKTMSSLIRDLANMNITPVGSLYYPTEPRVNEGLVLCLSRGYGRGCRRYAYTLADVPGPRDGDQGKHCRLPYAPVRG